MQNYLYKFGNIEVYKKFEEPTYKTFHSWRTEFLNNTNLDNYDICFRGNAAERIFGISPIPTLDVDIILSGEIDSYENLSNILNANYEIRHIHKTLKTLILASKFDHCLIELINKTKNKNLNLSIEAVISNHNDLKKISSLENLPFYHFPINNDKLKQEKRIIEFIDEKKIDIIILARYMQILSRNFVDRFYGKIINIHHSFLPSFKGAKPYHQAFERGVKIIGATAHFVNQNLDEGPIIEQDVEKVDHELSPSDLVTIGKDIEARVLYKAIKNFSEGRVFLNGKKTIVFKGDKIL